MIERLYGCDMDEPFSDVAALNEVLIHCNKYLHEMIWVLNGCDSDEPFSDVDAVNEMLSCQDRSALQVTLVSGGTFDSLVALLQKTSVSLKSV